MTESHEAPYFVNHQRRLRFPWSLYHKDLERALASAIASHGTAPRVLVVGCGLEPEVVGAPRGAIFHGCDLDARAVEKCKDLYPHLAGRLAACPEPYALPSGGAFDEPFDVVLAKEVIEHTDDPQRFARSLAERVAIGGELVLTTPNYGKLSTLALLERTVLEWVARRDGYSREHIHPSRFDKKGLARLDVGPGMELQRVRRAWHGWTLLGRWKRLSRAT